MHFLFERLSFGEKKKNLKKLCTQALICFFTCVGNQMFFRKSFFSNTNIHGFLID